jgi:CD63 antigen
VKTKTNKMGLPETTAKYLVFFFNFLFFISGIVIIAVGAVVRVQLSENIETHTGMETLKAGPIVLIVIGSFITLIAFFGCCGAIKSNYCMLMTFAGILFVIFISEFAIGITAYVNKDTIKTELHDWMNKEVDEFNKNVSRSNWNDYQILWECCGANNTVHDYCHDNKDDKNCKLPQGCCDFTKEQISKNATCTLESKELFQRGCYDATVDFVNDNVTKIGGVGIGIAFIQLLGIVLACCLGSAVRGSHQHV